MKDKKTNAVIALTSVLGSLLMLAALSFAIGKWSWGNNGYKIQVIFPAAVGIDPNSYVKYAGANVGRVTAVRLIPRRDQTQDPLTRQYNAISVELLVDPSVEIGADSSITIKTDGLGIAPKYILITPGGSHEGKILANNDRVQGIMPFDVTDLLQPAGEALHEARNLLGGLAPVLDRLDRLTQKLETDLPPMVEHANQFLIDGDSVLRVFNTPDSRQNLQELIVSLRVSSENLKVVSTNAKALTATLANKPWRVFWGGPTVKTPSEDAILKSNSVIRLKPDVEILRQVPESAPPDVVKRQ